MQLSTKEKPRHPWVEFADRVLPPLFVALCVGMGGGMWATYRSVDRLTVSIESQQRDLDALRNRLAVFESSLVTKQEMLETMKRVEQQLEIMMLRAGVRPDRAVNIVTP